MLLARLRRMSADELRWRARVGVRTRFESVASRVRPPQWQRAALVRILSRGSRDAELTSAVTHGEWMAAHEALAARLRARPAQFVLDPAAATQLREEVVRRWPGAIDAAAAVASRLLDNQYDLLGYSGLSYAAEHERVDWHLDPVHGRRAPRIFFADVPYLDPAVGDHKVIWELNRHQHWLRLGRAAWLARDSRYAARIIDDLNSWVAQNPPLVGINWASMLEIGFRSLSWVWALHCLLGLDHRSLPAGPWLVDLLVALHRQLTHVERNLSYYFSPNTHLTGEALALYVAGTALPELAAARRWADTGRHILLTESERQVLPDGGHAERSTHYQRYTLDFYLLALLTARLARDEEAEARFADAAMRLAEFTRAMATDSGELPLIGDDDGGMLWPLTGRACRDVRDTLALAASVLARRDLAPWGLTEEVLWIGGLRTVTCSDPLPASTPTPVPSRSFADTGYVVLRNADGDHGVLDAGAHGYMNGGHAHADALSLTLTLGGRTLLIDPGTFTYTMDPLLRNRFRDTPAHNTLTVDGRSQSISLGPFHWRTRADACLDVSRHNPAFDWVEAAHDGFRTVRHRRSLVRAHGSGWLVVDDVVGAGRHMAAAHWHFDPEWNVALDRMGLRAAHAEGPTAWLLSGAGDVTLHRGDTEPGLGWVAPAYGALVPATTARVCRGAEAPFTMVTWIGDGTWLEPVLSLVNAECDPSTPAVAVQIADGDRAAVFMLRPGGSTPHAARACRVGAFETDARMLHYRTAGDRLLVLDLAEGRYVRPSPGGWLALEAERRIPDLHVSLDEGVIDIQASAPLPPLRLRVAMPFHTARLNGREVPRDTTAEGLSIHSMNAAVNRPVSSPTRPWRQYGAAFADQ